MNMENDFKVRWCWPCQKEVQECAKKCECGRSPIVFPFTNASQAEWFRSQKYKYIKYKFASRWHEEEYPLAAKMKGDTRSKEEIKAEGISSCVLWRHSWVCPVHRQMFILVQEDEKACPYCKQKLYNIALDEQNKLGFKKHAKRGLKIIRSVSLGGKKASELREPTRIKIRQALHAYMAKPENKHLSLTTCRKNIAMHFKVSRRSVERYTKGIK